jgi:hypothetical protein
MRLITRGLEKIITTVATTTEHTTTFWVKLQRDIRKHYAEARRAFEGWAEREIVQWYDRTVRVVLKKVNRSTAFSDRKHIPFNRFIRSNIHGQGKKAVIQSALNAYTAGLNTGEKEIIRLTALTQQINVGQHEIDKRIADGELPDGTTFDVNKQIRNEILKKAEDGKYIAVIDKNGVKRMYNIKGYTEMVARTELREAATAGVVNTAAELGSDLIQVSSHNTLTPICQQFEGKIFSLSGDDPDFPQATLLAPFHPNCLHSITIVFREVLERRGIQPYIDFSTGKTEAHPTRESHIPVRKRKKK